jgi:hypothetical protein
VLQISAVRRDTIIAYVKIKFTLEQAMKAQRGAEV